MSKFLHDLSNLLAIVQGKVRQATKLVLSFENKEKTELLQMKLEAAMKEIERMEKLLNEEKATQKEVEETIKKKGEV